jgi:hypothetical protein
MKFIDIINKHLNEIYQNEDEFAYLSMTGKIENNVRDKLAFSLYKELKNDYYVLREFKGVGFTDRTDISILDKNNKIVCLVELKARAVSGIDKEFIGLLNKDYQKMKDKSEKSENISIVIFNNIKELGLEVKHLRYYKPKNLKNLEILTNKIEDDNNRIQKETKLKFSKKIHIESGNFYDTKIENIIYTYSNGNNI